MSDQDDVNLIELRVQSGTPIHTLAVSIVRNQEEGKKVSLSCIGPGAISQALKAVARSNGEVAQQGAVNVCLPAFQEKTIVDRTTGKPVVMTAVILKVIRIGL